MNTLTSDNRDFELESSAKQEYNYEAGESATLVTDQTRLCMLGAEAPEAVVLRRMLIVTAVVAVVALLIAIATLNSLYSAEASKRFR